MADRYDAIVIGSGPNGLAAAVVLAQAQRKVLVVEARDTIGGGTRSSELTLPGFIHDVCSAVHPLAHGSPFLSTLPLEAHGLKWVQPTHCLAHPFDDLPAAILDRSIDDTAASLGVDGEAYRRLMWPFVCDWPKLAATVLGPISFPKHPIVALRFALKGLRSVYGLTKGRFREARVQGLLGGMAGHAFLPLEKRPTGAFAIMLAVLGHRFGWPLAQGGSQSIADALASLLRSLGGETVTSREVKNVDELPGARVVLCDVTPRQLLVMAGHRLPERYVRRLTKYRYGMGAFKLDWALSQPVPWKDPACRGAGTLHLGGTIEEIAAGEAASWRGEVPERPMVLFAQPTLFDPTRAPPGKHTAWGYCHVPHACAFDMTERIEAQIERFAPGFRDCILARSVRGPAQLEAHNPNLVGGDINGGVQDIPQILRRPALRIPPYSTPDPALWLCSSSTPPGGGVHGMCGYHAARYVLKRVWGIKLAEETKKAAEMPVVQ